MMGTGKALLIGNQGSEIYRMKTMVIVVDARYNIDKGVSNWLLN